MSLTLALDVGSDECGPYTMSSQGGQCSRPRPTMKAEPCHPAFADKTMRLKSFEAWPLTLPDPETLTTAGFFYTGKGDQVLCYHCGKGLKDWVETDNPLEEHKKYFPNCAISNRQRPSLKPKATKQKGVEDESQSSSEHAIPDSLLCKVCFEEQMCITFLPCKHLVTCETCAPKFKECVVCRTKIKSALQVYLQ